MTLFHRMRRLASYLCVLALSILASCVTHSHVTDMSGVDGIRGEPIEYQSTTSYALHALFIFDLIGDASKTNTIERFTQEANENGGTRFRITQTSSSTYWYILPPISFFFHPVVTTVEGDVEGTDLVE